MCRRAVRDQLDERGTATGARALRGPLRDRIDREEVVAVDANARDAVTRTARRERALLAASRSLERGDRPLVVDDVHDDRRLVHGREDDAMVEVGLGARTFADPRAGDVVFV